MIVIQLIKTLTNQLEFNYKYTLDLIHDVDESKMYFTPNKGLENHPTFTVGHIITAYGLIIKKLGGEYTVSEKWDELFRRNGPGDPRYPTTDISQYPSKLELTQELAKQHKELLSMIQNLNRETLEIEVKWRYKTYFPKLIDFLNFMCITHYAMHIGQLAAWRRAMDMTSSLARL